MRDADCEAIGRLLSRSLDGELPAEERGKVEAHLAGCPSCRAALDAWSRIGVASVDLLRQAIPETPLRLEPPDAKAASIPWRMRRRRAPRRVPSLLTALVAAGLLAGLSVLLAVLALRGRAPEAPPVAEEIRAAERELAAREEARFRAEEEMARLEEERRRAREERERVERERQRLADEQKLDEVRARERAEAGIRRVVEEIEARHREAAANLAKAEAERRKADEEFARVRERQLPTAPAVAALGEIEGEVFVRSGSERSPARAGQALLAGQGIEAAGRAVVRYPDSTRLELGPETVVRELDDRAGKKIFMARGILRIEAARQPAGRPLVLETPQAEARVLGTRLVLSARAEETRLEVLEGKVRFTRSADRKTVDVVGGHGAVAAAGVDLVSRPLSRVLFADGFDAAPLNQWPAGWRRHPTEAAARSGFVVLQKGAERFIGCTGSPDLSQHAFVPVAEWGASFAVSFRLRLGGPRVTRAGVEIEDGRLDPSFEYDHQEGVVRADWPRGKALRQVPFRLAPGAWSDWKVTVEGRRFAVAVDRKPVLEVEMAEFGTARTVSLVSKGDDSAQFDDVKVLGLPGAGRR